MMMYKGYSAKIDYDDDAKVFHGEVIGIKDVITFQGTNVKGLEKEFHNSVNDYLQFCKERGEEPDRPYSGRFNLRITPELHAELWIAAQRNKQSLNQFVSGVLERELYR